MIDHSAMMLGKRPRRDDHRTLHLARYTAGLAEAPETCDLRARIPQPLGMMKNDRLGDCTCAAVGHLIQAWTGEEGAGVTLPDDVIVGLYERWCGYNPADPASDQGGVLLDVLNCWRRDTAEGHALSAYAAVALGQAAATRTGVYYFGALYSGLQLPNSAQRQDVWDVASGPAGEPGSWGGHCVAVVAYNHTGPICVTWGAFKQMTWEFWAKYADEAYALVGYDLTGARDRSPEGFDAGQLADDLAAL